VPETTSRYHRDTFSVFRILPWAFDHGSRTITMHYALDETHQFAEVVTLPDTLPFDATPADRSIRQGVGDVIDLLAVICGVSYFKVGAPRRIDVGFALTDAATTMAERAYDDGLGEFAYRNGLELPLHTTWQSARRASQPPPSVPAKRRPLLPMGGGRDSAVLASILAPLDPILTVHGENRFIDRLGSVLGLTMHHVGRTLDPLLFELNEGAALNGHVPVTAINSLIGTVIAVLCGATDVVMANERSASAASLTTDDGVVVNHQYSKGFEFEQLLAGAIASVGGPCYFSGLRPWGELAIARAFAARPQLHPVIMSCNRAFIRDPAMRSNGWCGRCDKCRFVFLTLAPFVDRPALVTMFGGDMFAQATNRAGFAALLDTDRRPWDCVGEPSEARLALQLVASLGQPSALTHEPGLALAFERIAGDLAVPAPARNEALAASSQNHVPEAYLPIIAAGIGDGGAVSQAPAAGQAPAS
jgi:UDP-N-acetyl-alpha-D-muramoyl-L-alanyl-L-glutamate epimerase